VPPTASQTSTVTLIATQLSTLATTSIPTITQPTNPVPLPIPSPTIIARSLSDLEIQKVKQSIAVDFACIGNCNQKVKMFSGQFGSARDFASYWALSETYVWNLQLKIKNLSNSAISIPSVWTQIILLKSWLNIFPQDEAVLTFEYIAQKAPAASTGGQWAGVYDITNSVYPEPGVRLSVRICGSAGGEPCYDVSSIYFPSQ
jgi:hypothetical protein